jgi:predicted secreted protein
MVQSKKKVGKSETVLVKEFCSRSSDDDLRALADLLPQTIAFDRSSACAILQKDNQVDRWLSQATGADDWFVRIDSVGDAAAAELDRRSSKK